MFPTVYLKQPNQRAHLCQDQREFRLVSEPFQGRRLVCQSVRAEARCTRLKGWLKPWAQTVNQEESFSLQNVGVESGLRPEARRDPCRAVVCLFAARFLPVCVIHERRRSEWAIWRSLAWGGSALFHFSPHHRNCSRLTPPVISQKWRSGSFDWTLRLPGSIQSSGCRMNIYRAHPASASEQRVSAS